MKPQSFYLNRAAILKAQNYEAENLKPIDEKDKTFGNLKATVKIIVYEDFSNLIAPTLPKP